MARLPLTKKLPWFMALQAGLLAREHLARLERAERQELQALIIKSRGRTSNLTNRERDRVRVLVDKLELMTLGRALVPVATGMGARKRRR